MKPDPPMTLLALVLRHPVNPWLTTDVLIRAPGLLEANAVAEAVLKRIEAHELN